MYTKQTMEVNRSNNPWVLEGLGRTLGRFFFADKNQASGEGQSCRDEEGWFRDNLVDGRFLAEVKPQYEGAHIKS